MAWRFGGANMMVFVVIAGLFPAVMDFLSSFVARNYEYPGQSRLWVFSYIGLSLVLNGAFFRSRAAVARKIKDEAGEDPLRRTDWY
jgi:hypothetical protein